MRTNLVIFALGALSAFVLAGWLHSWQTAKVHHSYVQVADTVPLEPVQQAGSAPEPQTIETVAPETPVEEPAIPAPSRNRTVIGRQPVTSTARRTAQPVAKNSTPPQPPEAQPTPRPLETATARAPESPAGQPPQPAVEQDRHPLKQRPPAAEHVPARGETEQPVPHAERAPSPQTPQQTSVPSPPRDPVVRERSPKMRAVIIAGSAAGGAIIGGIAGGGRGAAIGALTGAAGGYIYDRVTRRR